MIRYLLDTNVVSQPGKAKPNANVLAWLEGVDDAELAISVVTLHEIAYGAAKASVAGHQAAEALNAAAVGLEAAYSGRILPIDTAAAKLWAQLRAVQDKHVNDKALIAIAMTHGLVLVSANVKDLIGFGVAVLDPFKRPPRLHPVT